MNLRIRRNGKYYQIGYYEGKQFIVKKHLGSAEQLLKKLEHTKEETAPNNPEQNFCKN